MVDLDFERLIKTLKMAEAELEKIEIEDKKEEQKPAEEIKEDVENEEDTDALTMESFKAATKDIEKWAYSWGDMDLLFMYAEEAGKPFELGEAETVAILKDNGVNIIEIDGVNYFAANGITKEQIIEEGTKEGLF